MKLWKCPENDCENNKKNVLGAKLIRLEKKLVVYNAPGRIKIFCWWQVFIVDP